MAEIQREQKGSPKRHSLQMNGRETLTVNGVDDVVSFDEACIVLSTVCGIMSIDGTNMHRISLDTDVGSVEIAGSINGMIYPEGSGKSGGLFRRRQR